MGRAHAGRGARDRERDGLPLRRSEGRIERIGSSSQAGASSQGPGSKHAFSAHARLAVWSTGRKSPKAHVLRTYGSEPRSPVIRKETVLRVLVCQQEASDRSTAWRQQLGGASPRG